jgi:uncharacterized membrane protein
MVVMMSAGSAASAAPVFSTVGDFAGSVNSTVLLDVSSTGVAVGVDFWGTLQWRWSIANGYENIGGAGGFATISGDGQVIYGDIADGLFPNPPAYSSTQAMARYDGPVTGWTSLGGFIPCDATLSWVRDTNLDGTICVGAGWTGGCQTRALVHRPGLPLLQLNHYFALGGSCVANATSDDGSVVVGFNNGNGPGGRTGVYWLNSGQATLVRGSISTGELRDVSGDGRYILGHQRAATTGDPGYAGPYVFDRVANQFTDIPAIGGGPAGSSYTPSAITRDGNVVVGNGFIWRRGIGTQDLRQYIEGYGVTIPDVLTGLGAATTISADGRYIGGYGSHVTAFPPQQGWVFDHGVVTCPSDLDDDGVFPGGNPDGGVTIEDLLFFVEAFAQGDLAADLDNGSGTGTRDQGVTIDDLVYFVQRFGDGC